jgi:hypothetical protein
MTQAQTSPETPNMLYPGCTLQAEMAGQPKPTFPAGFLYPRSSPWPRRRSTDPPMARELCQPRTEADMEARYGEQPESFARPSK